MNITSAWLPMLTTPGGGSPGPFASSQNISALGDGLSDGLVIDATTWPATVMWLADTNGVGGTVEAADMIIQGSPNGSSGFLTLSGPVSLLPANSVHSGIFTRTQPFLRSRVSVVSPGDDTATLAVMLLGVAAGGVDLEGMGVGLYTAVVDRGQHTTLADLTRPAGDPGAIQTFGTLSAPISLADGSLAFDGVRCSWRPASAAEATTVAGWFLQSAGGSPVLLGWESFDQPVPLADASSSLSLRPRLIYPAAAPWVKARSYGG